MQRSIYKVSIMKLSIFIVLAIMLICHSIMAEEGAEEKKTKKQIRKEKKAAKKRGPPGPPGPQGPKGEAGENCVCPLDGFTDEEIEKLKEFVRSSSSSSSCADEKGESGVYTIYPYPESKDGLEVFCDLETDNGGWMVIQRRKDGSEDFYRNFDDYVKGFGNVEGEFWMGLDLMHFFTGKGGYELRVDMEDFDGEKRYAKYSDFSVGEGKKYTLTVGGYDGDAGDSMENQNTMAFSAKDFDQDLHPTSCSDKFDGAWWYRSCHTSNPNGLYLEGKTKSYANGVVWRTFRGFYYSLKTIEFKIRKKSS